MKFETKEQKKSSLWPPCFETLWLSGQPRKQRKNPNYELKVDVLLLEDNTYHLPLLAHLFDELSLSAL